MKISTISDLLYEYIEDVEPIIIEINKSELEDCHYNKNYNKKIRDNIKPKCGIYLWVDANNDEVLYIGMAGRIKNNGCFSGHSLSNRLQASREKCNVTKKDIQTNSYIKTKMQNENIECMKIFVYPTKDGVAPAFLESLLLNDFYKEKRCLPKFNKSF
ncbi:hypothetical protein [uncultured Chryseobacterium sp.]|uniref:hypothetical protein n=1 Tax=uncultured Chryseobacterium sp. TaxID=259322 RepID=UPI00261BF410|nr:hypothetical protein [uncultured Chryseobacterium sp.]